MVNMGCLVVSDIGFMDYSELSRLPGRFLPILEQRMVVAVLQTPIFASELVMLVPDLDLHGVFLNLPSK